ncbi:hypothetical protein COOONC_05964 [Cooperia oncophora]
METPLGRHSVKDRRVKRRPPLSTPSDDGHLLERAAETDELRQKNSLLEKRLESEIAENSRLKMEINSLKEALAKSNEACSGELILSNTSNYKPKHDCCEHSEMNRAIVIHGIAEFDSTDCTQRISHLRLICVTFVLGRFTLDHPSLWQREFASVN